MQAIAQFFSTAKAFIKETWALPYAKLYLALSLIMVPFFVFLTFPYEILIRNQLQKLESTMGRNIQIGVIDFSVIGQSYIDYLNITFSNGAELNLKDIMFDISINPYRLFVSKKIRGEIQISSFKYAKSDLSITNNLKTSFNIQFDGKTGIPTNGDVDVELTNASLKGITIKGFDIPALKFSSIKGAGTLKSRRLRIDSFTFSGSDVNGEIKGSIQIEPMANASKINLFIYINQDSRILQEYKMLLDSLADSGGKIKIEITGNFINPNVKLPLKSGDEGKSAGRDESDKDIQKRGNHDDEGEPKL
jgi:hypothetical protein